MSNIFPGQRNVELEEKLEKLPDAVADAKEVWLSFRAGREKKDALLYAQFKGEDEKRSATDIKELIKANDDHYRAILQEIKAECDYDRLYEKLMCTKKLCDMRTAF